MEISNNIFTKFAQGVELRLKHVHATGIYGWGSVCETIIGEWLEDISHNQVQCIFPGIGVEFHFLLINNFYVIFHYVDS